jgi:aerobic-type carbon monoxide dehydrogenase small subunit (CoxS/CutS family)
MIMTAAALVDGPRRPDVPALEAALAGHICRCGTYPRIRRALQRLVEAGR